MAKKMFGRAVSETVKVINGNVWEMGLFGISDGLLCDWVCNRIGDTPQNQRRMCKIGNALRDIYDVVEIADGFVYVVDCELDAADLWESLKVSA